MCIRDRYQGNCWGVPSFKITNADGSNPYYVWGQDRMWLVKEEIYKRIESTWVLLLDLLNEFKIAFQLYRYRDYLIFMKEVKKKRRNPVAKNSRKFNKSAVFADKTKYNRKVKTSEENE